MFAVKLVQENMIIQNKYECSMWAKTQVSGENLCDNGSVSYTYWEQHIQKPSKLMSHFHWRFLGCAEICIKGYRSWGKVDRGKSLRQELILLKQDAGLIWMTDPRQWRLYAIAAAQLSWQKWLSFFFITEESSNIVSLYYVFYVHDWSPK